VLDNDNALYWEVKKTQHLLSINEFGQWTPWWLSVYYQDWLHQVLNRSQLNLWWGICDEIISLSWGVTSCPLQGNSDVQTVTLQSTSLLQLTEQVLGIILSHQSMLNISHESSYATFHDCTVPPRVRATPWHIAHTTWNHLATQSDVHSFPRLLATGIVMSGVTC